MFLLEALRQAGIATNHLEGLPLTGTLTLSSFNTRFFNFVNKNAPTVIRAYRAMGPVDDQQDHDVTILCGVYQWGKLCADAELNGIAFGHASSYTRQRDRSVRIGARSQRMYLNSLQALGH